MTNIINLRQTCSLPFKGRAGVGSFAFLFLLLIAGCSNDFDPKPYRDPSGALVFSIHHVVHGDSLRRNELIYTNAAGNTYMVTGLKYFISDITLYRHDGKQKVINESKEIFYIDEDIPATRKIDFTDKIPEGRYDSISFVFGLTGEKNKSHRFVNPPEVLMGWPEVLGGGYHYMMLDGKWKNAQGEVVPQCCCS